MSKIVRLNPVATSIRPQRLSPAACLNSLKHLTLNSINQRNLRIIIEFLSHAEGDSELIQDMKALVIRRIANEALSMSNAELFKEFDQLLSGFPNVPMMRDFMIPQARELGEATEVIEACRPRAGDSPMIIRAKREALMFNITMLIQDNYVEYSGIQTPRIKRAEFIRLFSWIWEMSRQFQPRIPDELAQLIDIHVLKPELPFDIHLAS